MQLPSGRSGGGGSDFKRGVVQSWLPEATKLDGDWQLGGHWQPANIRQPRPKVRGVRNLQILAAYQQQDLNPSCAGEHIPASNSCCDDIS